MRFINCTASHCTHLAGKCKKQLYDPAEDYNSHNEIGYHHSENKKIKIRLSHRPHGEKERNHESKTVFK